jgi:hypothetical protein
MAALSLICGHQGGSTVSGEGSLKRLGWPALVWTVAFRRFMQLYNDEGREGGLSGQVPQARRWREGRRAHSKPKVIGSPDVSQHREVHAAKGIIAQHLSAAGKENRKGTLALAGLSGAEGRRRRRMAGP